MKKTWIRNLLKIFSLTSAAFIFQACYGIEQDEDHDYIVYGKVVSRSTGLPVKGIQVSIDSTNHISYTNDSGRFDLYSYELSKTHIRFEDIDSTANHHFEDFDTLITPQLGESIELSVQLEDKQ